MSMHNQKHVIDAFTAKFLFNRLIIWTLCRGTTEGDVAVVMIKKMEVMQLIGSVHNASVTGLEFSKHGRYCVVLVDIEITFVGQYEN